MGGKRKSALDKALKWIRWIPLFVIAVIVVIGVIYRREITVDRILNYTPSNYLLAGMLLVLFYALKSLSIMFPIFALYMSAGMLFTPFWAIVVNLIGLAVCLSLPFFVGRWYGTALADKLVKKYPRAQQLDRFKENNMFFLVYIVKMVGVIPCDISSMLFGAMRIPYRTYLPSAVFGMTPCMLAVTFLGITVTDTRSPGFIFSCVALVLTAMLSVVCYRIYLKRLGKRK